MKEETRKKIYKRIMLVFFLLTLTIMIVTTYREVAARYSSSVTKAFPAVAVHLKNRRVPIPEGPESKVYNGLLQTVSVDCPDGAAVSGDFSGTDAGIYEIRLRLEDPAHDCWEDGSTADLVFHWGIYVCRIGGIYYTSVTAAFQSNLSTAEDPVTMLCDYSEEAVNESGNDYYDPAGFTLSSGGTTIYNLGGLVIDGNGTVSSVSSSNNHVEALRNAGTLVVENGDFYAEYTGSLTSGYEVYGLRNDSGNATVNGGSFELEGAALCAEILCVNGGTVTVNGGAFHAENAAPTHGCYVVWIENETALVRINDGTFYAENRAGYSHGYSGYGGRIELCGGRTSIYADTGDSDNIFHAMRRTEIYVSGGTHHIGGSGDLYIGAVTDRGVLSVSGGSFQVRMGNAGNYRVHGFLCEAGTFVMSGGAAEVLSSGSGGTLAAAVINGEMRFAGGGILVSNPNGSLVQGLCCGSGSGTMEMDGLDLEITAANGQAEGFSMPDLSSSMTLRSGNAFLQGKTVVLGNSAKTIQLPNPQNLTVMVRYIDSFRVGGIFSRNPVVTSAVRQTSIP